MKAGPLTSPAHRGIAPQKLVRRGKSMYGNGRTRPALAVELAPIRVNCVIPGVVRQLWTACQRQTAITSTKPSVIRCPQTVSEAEDIAWLSST